VIDGDRDAFSIVKTFQPKFFKKVGEEVSNYTDEGFLKKISNQVESNCFRGDVLSDCALQKVYDAVLKVTESMYIERFDQLNPSPYLFLF